MSIIALASLKASPGVTTTALALAGAWPTEQRVVVAEFDPAGGDLAARFGLASEPSLVSLAAAARRDCTDGLIWEHTRNVLSGLPIVVGPPAAQQAGTAVAMVAQGLLPAVRDLQDTVVIADCGRLDPGSPALGVVEHCDVLLLVARPELAEMHHLAAGLPALRTATANLGVVLMGTGPYQPSEIAATLGVEVVSVLPHDPQAARLLAGDGGSSRVLSRTSLMRAAHGLAAVVAARMSRPMAGPASTMAAELAHHNGHLSVAGRAR